MTLADLDAAERRMDVHLLHHEYGLTSCGLNASTVHWTALVAQFDCRACAREWLADSCYDDDPRHCEVEAHARAAALAYPKMEVVR